jgi:L-amino acid N-acyltransferase YncA
MIKRREFITAVGTAAAVASSSQAFAQTGAGGEKESPHAPIGLRLATNEDADIITDIWRKGVASSLGFEAELPEVKDYFSQCIQEHSDTSKFWVALDHEQNVIGWQSLRPTRANPIIRRLVAESSTYVDPKYGIHGVGTALIQMASHHADISTLQYLTGYISANNTAMRRIVSKAGWLEVGRVPPSMKAPIAPEASFWIYIAKGGK